MSASRQTFVIFYLHSIVRGNFCEKKKKKYRSLKKEDKFCDMSWFGQMCKKNLLIEPKINLR